MSLFVTRLTGSGASAIAVLELIGEGVTRIVAGLFDRPLMPPGQMAVGRLRDEGPVDEVVVRIVPSAESFCRDEAVEIHCHGGEAVIAGVLELLRGHGVVELEPEARIDRACRNGAIDVFQAEAFRLLPGALTERAARVLLDQAHGALSRALREGREVLQTANFGIALTSPRRIVLAGRPNVGKSTLFNTLYGRDRVLVSPQAGTTRDAVREWIAIEGIPFELCDTAGVDPRGTSDSLELLSVDRTRETLAGADLVLFLQDAAEGVRGEGERLLESISAPVVRVVNKIDLGPPGPGVGCRISARTGEGLDALRSAVLDALDLRNRPASGSAVVFTERLRATLQRDGSPEWSATAAGRSATHPADRSDTSG